MRQKSKRCVREIIVAGIYAVPLLRDEDDLLRPGSSKVFNSALKAPVEAYALRR